MTAVEIEQTIRKFIGQNFLFGQGVDGLRGRDSFMEKGIVDSTGVLELIAFLEQQFGVAVQDDELVPENLDSVDSVVGFVGRKLAAAS
jgi:acyl carrier protein